MRLAILDNGHRFKTRIFLAGLRAVSRLPVPDAVKVNRYRPDFYGLPMRVLTQNAMRGPSPWSVGDRELMGAVVSQTNECEVCTKTHAGVAALAYCDEPKVSMVLANLDTAPIAPCWPLESHASRSKTHSPSVSPSTRLIVCHALSGLSWPVRRHSRPARGSCSHAAITDPVEERWGRP